MSFKSPQVFPQHLLQSGAEAARVAPHSPGQWLSHPGYLLMWAQTGNTRATAAVAGLTQPGPLPPHRTRGSCLPWPRDCFLLAP